MFTRAQLCLGILEELNRPCVSDHGRKRLLQRVAQNIISITNRSYLHGGNFLQKRLRQASLASCELPLCEKRFTRKQTSNRITKNVARVNAAKKRAKCNPIWL